MTVIIKEPNSEPVISNIDSDLNTLQKLVGGYIECIKFDTNFVIIVDEEGYIKRLTPNIKYCGKVLVGTIVISSIKNGEFVSLPQKSINNIIEYLKIAPLY